MTAPPIVEACGLHAYYETSHVLHGIDLTIERGEAVSLMGRNGMGKTTILRSLTGLLRPRRGSVRVHGRDMTGAKPHRVALEGLALVPEGRGIFPNLTVRENLRMATYTGRSWHAIEDIAYSRFPVLGERRNQLAGTMSGGEQQMLAMARALATDPAILLLDELSMGLAPTVVEYLYENVAALAGSGIAILIAEQFARTVLAVADIAAIMLHGRIAAVGPPAEIEAELSSAYLGQSQEEHR